MGSREGWVFGLDMFAGNALGSNAHGAAGMGVRIGRMLRPDLALMLDTHGAAVGTSDIGATDVSSTVLVRALAAASVQWWPRRRFWLRGGVGPGRVEGATASVGFASTVALEEVKTGFGATMATGFELYQGRLFALDVNARYTGIRAGGDGYSNLVVGLGFGWYPQSNAVETQAAAPRIPDPQRKPKWRDRWIVGLGVLGGRPINNDCSDCYWDVGAGMDLQLGRMITPRLALMLDTHGVAVGRSQIEGFDAEANALVQGVVGVAAQYWTGPRTWIRGAIGRGEVRASVTVTEGNASAEIIETEYGLGASAAAGYEIYQKRSLGVNAYARYAQIHGDQLSRGSLVLGLGVGWYP